MKAKHHLIVGIIFIALLAFEIIAFTDILKEPYMVGLCIFLGCVGGYNLGMAFNYCYWHKK